MASLRDIRKRIRSIKSSQKITKAMKLVAASKLRRSQEAITAARPYAVELGGTLRRVARALGDVSGGAPHPLLELRAPRRVLLVVVTSDRGLCGAFNTNITRRAERFIRENEGRFEKLEVATIGKKGRDYFQRRKLGTVRDFPGVIDKLSFMKVSEIAKGIIDEYQGQDLDAVYVIYNEFKSAISQKTNVDQLLPIVQEDIPDGATGDGADYLYEPSQPEVLNGLVPRYVTTLLWRALLESVASEHGARMTAMDSATKNAKELGETLTLQYNRTRQAAITRELMEIVGGAEALNG